VDLDLRGIFVSCSNQPRIQQSPYQIKSEVKSYHYPKIKSII
jgi:hypothetical protein